MNGSMNADAEPPYRLMVQNVVRPRNSPSCLSESLGMAFLILAITSPISRLSSGLPARVTRASARFKTFAIETHQLFFSTVRYGVCLAQHMAVCNGIPARSVGREPLLHRAFMECLTFRRSLEPP